MKSYPLFKVHVDVDAALAEIRTVLESGFVNEGLQVGQFLTAASEFLGVEQLVLTNSGTSALTMALKLCGVGPGTEVVTTAMTCVATNTPIDNLGSLIVWADIDPASGSIDPADVERKITPATRAIMCVAWAGTPCDLDALGEVARRHSLPLIQDAAHALGATWRGRPVAEFADYTCYSFQAIKHLSTGDGGALVCRDKDRFVLARKLKWFGYDRDAHKDEKGEWKGQRWSADIEPGEVGYKFNMNNVAAAIGLSQMKHIGSIVARHRANAAVFQRVFSASSLVKPLTIPQQAGSSYWVFTALTDKSVNRDRLLERLNAEGIAAGLVHLPNDLYSAFRPYETALPGTREFADRQISLPCGWWLTESDCEWIAGRVKALAV
ncbi:MAG: DegT/DnrJ/EryC1/StrS family aminotransferase [Hyphomicrobiaceae bacterium]